MNIDTQQIKQSINLIEYASPYTTLRRESTQESSGPCPICNDGNDRFHVSVDWWFCRQCHPKRGDAIELAQLVNGWSFRQACENLSNGGLSIVDRPIKPKPTVAPQPQEKRKKIAEKAHYFTSVLSSPNGAPGRDYLTSRGITPVSAKTFNLGYSRKRNAISIPWLDPNGNITAIRYRHINPEPGKPKVISEMGSRFSSLYGYHAHLGCAQQYRTLIVCEGELNAISTYQATAGSNVDVLSVGSESTRVQSSEIDMLAAWRHSFLWMDKREKLGDIAPSFRFDWYINSPNSKDANDMLRKSILSPFLAMHRIKACKGHVDNLEGILWDYWDAKQEGGIDPQTEVVMMKLADDLKRRWV